MITVNEIFYSLQGEGADAGIPTVFIRLTGCNLRCSYCDTRYAWDEGVEKGVNEILEELGAWNCRKVCVTGGEPLLQKGVYDLIDILLERKYEVSVETNGSLTITMLVKKNVVTKMDVKLPSSGEHKKMMLANIPLLRQFDELKFIIGDRNDYEYAKKIMDAYRPTCQIIMQPVWGKAPELAEWILQDELDVRYSLQLHKLLWGNERKR